MLTSAKKCLVRRFLVENHYSIVGPYLCTCLRQGSDWFSIYMGGGTSLSPPCEISPAKKPCEIGLSDGNCIFKACLYR